MVRWFMQNILLPGLQSNARNNTFAENSEVQIPAKHFRHVDEMLLTTIYNVIHCGAVKILNSTVPCIVPTVHRHVSII